MNIGEIVCALPWCGLSFSENYNKEQTETSRNIRITASALGAIAILVGVLALIPGMPVLYAIAPIGAGILIAGGCLLTLAMASFKGIAEQEEQTTAQDDITTAQVDNDDSTSDTQQTTELVTTSNAKQQEEIPEEQPSSDTTTSFVGKTEIKPTNAQPDKKKEVPQLQKEPKVAKSSDPSTPSVSKEAETKAKAPVVAVDEILPRILSYMYGNAEKKGIVKQCEMICPNFRMFRNQYDLNRIPYSNSTGTVRIDKLEFGLPITTLELCNLAFYFVLTGEYKGCKIESTGSISSMVVCFKTNMTSSDTGFYTKELLLQIDEVISKFPPIESFPKQNIDIKYAYENIKRAHFNRLTGISFGTAKEADLKYKSYYPLGELSEENLKFLVDSNIIKSWELDSSQNVVFTLSEPETEVTVTI